MLRHGSHSFTCKLHHACLSFVSVHRMAPPLTEVADIRLQLTTHRPQRDARLSWPDWLTYSGWFTHISGHPSATGRAQDREMCTVAVPRKAQQLEWRHLQPTVIQNMSQITSKSSSTLLLSIIYLFPKFHENPPTISGVIMLTDRQTVTHRSKHYLCQSVVEVKVR